MRVVVFGSTGRVGAAAVRSALAGGHQVRAAMRRVPAAFPFDAAVEPAIADVLQPATVSAALAGMDAVIVAVGGDVFAPSTIVTESARAIVAAMQAGGPRRYVGITGVAQMQATAAGKLAQAALRISPIKHAVADHQGAYEIVAASGLDWTLAGCPWIKDDAHPGQVHEHPDTFPGGFHSVAPVDVGAFLAAQLESNAYVGRIVGLW